MANIKETKPESHFVGSKASRKARKTDDAHHDLGIADRHFDDYSFDRKRIDHKSMKLSRSAQKRMKKYEEAVKDASINRKRTEVLLHERAGFLEVENEDLACTTEVKQKDVVKHLNTKTANNFFQLKLTQFGPYSIKYTHNGKFILLGGVKGHLAAFDWKSRKLKFEVHVNDRIRDIVWLHNETRLAVAQKEKTFIYDNKGVELSKVNVLHRAIKLEFLPYHFLLVGARKAGYLTYVDTSIGKLVTDIKMGMGDPVSMQHNPRNAIVHVGHNNGAVSLWSPNTASYLLKILAHPAPIVSLAVSNDGNYMATSDVSRHLKVWDIRSTYKCLRSYRTATPACSLTFSQSSLLAFNVGSVVEIWKNVSDAENCNWQYMRHTTSDQVSELRFCPYEDVLGVGHTMGLDSIIVPGCGEPNFDAWEANPYETIQQRHETEVKSLLDKVQHKHITLNTEGLLNVAQPKENEKEVMEERLMKRILPKMPRKNKSAKKLHRAQTVVRNLQQREKRLLQRVHEEQEKLKEQSESD